MLRITEEKQLFALLQDHATIITPNNRLSNELITHFFQANNRLVQEKPACLPYRAFLQHLFSKYCHEHFYKAHPVVLTAQQLRHLWRQILSTHLITDTLNEGLLQAITEAWTRCHLWQLDFHHPAFSSTPQTRQFQQAALQLQEQLSQLNAITEDQLVSYLTQLPSIVGSIIWACFDDYTPQQLALQKQFEGQKYEQYEYDLSNNTSMPHQYAASNEQDERQQLIHWLHQRLASNDKRIGVVIPDLHEQSQQLQRLLQQQFSTTQFNISLGKPLLDYPLVAHALNWLHLDGKKLTHDQAKLLLHSPYLAFSQEEMLVRAHCMEESTIFRELQFDYSLFLQELRHKAPRLANLLGHINQYPAKASPSAWIAEFKTRLTKLGFPGEYPLNSESYQCCQRFTLLFDEFKQLAFITPIMSQTEALLALTDLAKSTIFQPKASTTASIQLLGLLEASGCTFDSLWVIGVTDECLPQKTQLSAFIPIALQRDYLMPYACPVRELQLAKKMLTRLAQSSALCIFSYPGFLGDKLLAPSPLITHLPPFQTQKNGLPQQQCALVSFVESYEITMGLEEQITGGSAILANQAQCPFRAFATHRLHVKTSHEPSYGPDAKERGQLIHKIMELLWRTLKNQQTLLTLESTQLEQTIETAITQALEPIINQRPYSFPLPIQEAEWIRLKRLIRSHVDWERTRPPFTVEALEQAFILRLEGMDLHVRVDRLDRVSQEKKWVIDYKSSLPQSSPWKKERPQDPQLLLYALLDEAIDTLLLIQVKTGQLLYMGLSEQESSLAGITSLKKEESWLDYRQHWQTQLSELVKEFSQGHCSPTPNSASVCQQCDYQRLCRSELY